MKTTALACCLLVLAGCAVHVPTAARAPSAPAGVRVGPVLVTAAGDATDSTSPAGCVTTVHRFRTATGDYLAAALPQGCAATDGTPQNGDHGYYPQPPATAQTEQASTPVGTATLFTNPYSECSSSCYIGGDEVALVTVDGTVVQVMAISAPAGGTADRSRSDLIAVLQTLRHV